MRHHLFLRRRRSSTTTWSSPKPKEEEEVEEWRGLIALLLSALRTANLSEYDVLWRNISFHAWIYVENAQIALHVPYGCIINFTFGFSYISGKILKNGEFQIFWSYFIYACAWWVYIQDILWYYDQVSPNQHNNFLNYFGSKSLGKSTTPLFYINSFGENWPILCIWWSPGEKLLWPNFLIVINDSHASPGLIAHSYTDLCSIFDISHFTHVTFIYHLSDFRHWIDYNS